MLSLTSRLTDAGTDFGGSGFGGSGVSGLAGKITVGMALGLHPLINRTISTITADLCHFTGKILLSENSVANPLSSDVASVVMRKTSVGFLVVILAFLTLQVLLVAKRRFQAMHCYGSSQPVCSSNAVKSARWLTWPGILSGKAGNITGIAGQRYG